MVVSHVVRVKPRTRNIRERDWSSRVQGRPRTETPRAYARERNLRKSSWRFSFRRCSSVQPQENTDKAFNQFFRELVGPLTTAFCDSLTVASLSFLIFCSKSKGLKNDVEEFLLEMTWIDVSLIIPLTMKCELLPQPRALVSEQGLQGNFHSLCSGDRCTSPGSLLVWAIEHFLWYWFIFWTKSRYIDSSVWFCSRCRLSLSSLILSSR